jgi:hypothetical protein
MTDQSCNCLSEFNKKLEDHNTEIDVTFCYHRDGRPMTARPKISTSKLETRKRVGPVIAAPTFCPFCGKPYEQQPAAPATVTQGAAEAIVVALPDSDSAGQRHLREALHRASTNCGEWMREARARQEQTVKLLEAIDAILPSTLCGESWNLPDEETVSITVTFGKLRAARAAATDARGAV